jgi:hypothetical protein
MKTSKSLLIGTVLMVVIAFLRWQGYKSGDWQPVFWSEPFLVVLALFIGYVYERKSGKRTVTDHFLLAIAIIMFFLTQMFKIMLAIKH